MYKTYKGHFNSPRRWSYVIISVVGDTHRHYIVDNIYDSPSLYGVNVVTDKPGYYSVNNIVNRDSIFVIYYKGDYRK